MKSGAITHFPQVVTRRGRKALWNPVSRKPLVNRPEERVRLRFIDYLTYDCGWPLSRISVEQSLGRSHQAGQQRADIICYSREFQPRILVECKAEAVALDESAARQIASYNRQVEAPLICLTNGNRDLWYRLNHDGPRKLEPLTRPPSELTRGGTSERWRRNLHYWHRRGFAGSTSLNAGPQWLTETLNHFWSDRQPGMTSYLAIDETLDGVDYSHYYKIAETDEESRIAISFMTHYAGHTCLTAILNRAGENRGVLTADLNRASESMDGNCTIMLPAHTHTTDLLKHLPIAFFWDGTESKDSANLDSTPVDSDLDSADLDPATENQEFNDSASGDPENRNTAHRERESGEGDAKTALWLRELPHYLTELFERYV